MQSLFKMVVDAIVSFSTTQGDFDMIKACLVERLLHYCVVIFHFHFLMFPEGRASQIISEQ